MIEFKVGQFEGALDLLLHLIKENKMSIFDIEIEKITEQYLAYIEKMEEMNLEVTSNYLVMASELIYIKSRMLLPKKEDIDDLGDEEDPRDELVHRLLEYQAYKDITDTLREKENIRKEIYTKAPEDIQEYLDQDTKLNMDISLDNLVDAFKNFLIRQEEAKPLKTKVTQREISVSDRKKKIRGILGSKKRVNFFEFFEDYSREYVVATFLAVLEMAKEKELKIIQDHIFGDIVCEVA